MNEDMQNEERAVDTSVDTGDAPAADTSVDADSDTQAEEVEDQGSENATLQDNQESNQSDDDISRWDSYLPQNRATQIEQDMINEDGYIDPAKYAEKIKKEVREEIRFESQERRAWEKLEDKYPEIKTDKDLREIILAKRINDVSMGGDGSLIKSAETVMRKFGSARQEGKAAAKTSIERQKRGGTVKATAPRDTSQSDIQQRVRSGDPNAIASILSGWIDEGKI